jgi:hypothetical protein
MKEHFRKFSNSVINDLKYYVYIYSHPKTKEIFYIGKGKENRVFAHLEEQKESEKVRYINELKKNGLEPKIEILIHGLEDEKIALRVESSIIDLIGIGKLTNMNNGYKSASFGRMTLEQINSHYDKQKTDISEPAILIRINQAFRYSMTERELYDYTRGFWKISLKSSEKVKYGFAIYQGIIQEVYEIFDWHKAGSTENVRNLDKKELKKIENRIEFTGKIADNKIREKYQFKSVEHYFKKGNSNPIMYLNIK